MAAGTSSRLGRPKQLVKFQNKFLLQHIIDIVAILDFESTVVVLGAHADKIVESIIPKNCNVLNNKNWSEGIASSIRLGVSESKKLNESLKGILFLLSDQPFVTKQLIEELIQKHANGNQQITACSYKDNIGVPAIFGKEFFPDLLKLTGDVGARKIMMQNKEHVEHIVFKDGSFDIDTEEDVQELLDKET